jgi:hypothetical protein
MSHLPTDREVLRCIFEMYESAYPGETNGGKGVNDPYVPVGLDHRSGHPPTPPAASDRAAWAVEVVVALVVGTAACAGAPA